LPAVDFEKSKTNCIFVKIIPMTETFIYKYNF